MSASTLADCPLRESQLLFIVVIGILFIVSGGIFGVIYGIITLAIAAKLIIDSPRKPIISMVG